MKKISSFLPLFLWLSSTSTAYGAPVKTTSYQPLTENIANPERGFFTNADSYNGEGVFSDEICLRAKEQRITIVRQIFVFSEYRNRLLDSKILQNLEDFFNKTRACGLKAYPLFAYNFPKANEWDYKNPPPDAPLSVVRNHIRQLRPIFHKHADVIADIPMGFVGAWGEWHSSPYKLDSPQSRQAILREMLKVLPVNRSISLRLPQYKRDYLRHKTALTGLQAFSGTAQSRISSRNDCFLAAKDMEALKDGDKTYLNRDNRFLAQGGETCMVNPPETDCPNAMKRLKQERWSLLNVDFHKDVIDGWRTQGCFNEIHKKLGYRLRLINANMPDSVKAGNSFKVSLRVANDGYAAPFNPRFVELVLRNKSTGAEYRTPIDTDPRRWLRGKVYVLGINWELPKEMEKGEYEVLLNLPDPAPTLYNRPEYSIRLANRGLWEPATGFNSLKRTLAIQ